MFSSYHVLTEVNVFTIILHSSCLTVDSTAYLDSMFPTRLREERGGETDWRTPHPRPASSVPSSPKSSTPRTSMGHRTLSGSFFYSYSLSWWSRPHLISTMPTTSRSIQQVFSCQVVHVVRKFIVTWCSYYNAFIMLE